MLSCQLPILLAVSLFVCKLLFVCWPVFLFVLMSFYLFDYSFVNLFVSFCCCLSQCWGSGPFLSEAGPRLPKPPFRPPFRWWFSLHGPETF